MPVKNREQLLLIVVLLCVGLLGADSLLLTPLIKKWSDRSKKIEILSENLNKGAMLVGREKTLQDRWNEMGRESRSAADTMTENQVLNSVSTWATSSRLTVTSLKPHWSVEDECRKLEIRVSATGSLSAIARFLYELEIDPQALKVEDVELSTKDEKGQAINCDVRFTRLVLEDGKKS